MKTKNFSFLFLIIILLHSYILVSQEKKDSLQHYVELVKKSKDFSKLTNAFIYLKKDKEFNLLNNTTRSVYDLIYISRVQRLLGIYYDSETSAIIGLKLLDDMPNSSIKSPELKYRNILRTGLLNELGILKRKLKSYNESFKYYDQVLEFSETKTDSLTAYNNIGVTYNFLHKYGLAKIELEKAYSLGIIIKDTIKISLALDNLGYAKSMLNDDEGLANMKEALLLRKKTNDSEIYNSYKHLSEYFNKKKNYKKSLFYGRKGYNITNDYNLLPDKRDALTNLIQLGENKFAAEYLEVVEKMDSIRFANENQYASAKYNLEDEHKKTKLAELETSKQMIVVANERSKRIIYQAIGFMLFIGSFFLFYILRIRHKKEKLKTRFDTEQSISKKLHDEVANDVYSMMSRLQNDPNTKKEIIDNLEVVYLKTRDISKTNASLNVSENFEALLKDLIASYKTTDVKIFTRNISQVSWDAVSDLKKETLYRVIQELMTNMKKHSQATIITLQFQEKNNKVSITYVDNGIGCELNHGNGLRNTENRMEMASCRITFESEINKGFQAKLLI